MLSLTWVARIMCCKYHAWTFPIGGWEGGSCFVRGDYSKSASELRRKHGKMKMLLRSGKEPTDFSSVRSLLSSMAWASCQWEFWASIQVWSKVKTLLKPRPRKKSREITWVCNVIKGSEITRVDLLEDLAQDFFQSWFGCSVSGTLNAINPQMKSSHTEEVRRRTPQNEPHACALQQTNSFLTQPFSCFDWKIDIQRQSHFHILEDLTPRFCLV